MCLCHSFLYTDRLVGFLHCGLVVCVLGRGDVWSDPCSNVIPQISIPLSEALSVQFPHLQSCFSPSFKSLSLPILYTSASHKGSIFPFFSRSLYLSLSLWNFVSLSCQSPIFYLSRHLTFYLSLSAHLSLSIYRSFYLSHSSLLSVSLSLSLYIDLCSPFSLYLSLLRFYVCSPLCGSFCLKYSRILSLSVFISLCLISAALSVTNSFYSQVASSLFPSLSFHNNFIAVFM